MFPRRCRIWILELLALRPEGRPADAADGDPPSRFHPGRRDRDRARFRTNRPARKSSRRIGEKTISSSEAVTSPMSGGYTPTEAGSRAVAAAQPARRTLVETGPSEVEVAAPAFAVSTQPSPRYPVWAFVAGFAVLACTGLWLTTGNREQRQPEQQAPPVSSAPQSAMPKQASTPASPAALSGDRKPQPAATPIPPRKKPQGARTSLQRPQGRTNRLDGRSRAGPGNRLGRIRSLGIGFRKAAWRPRKTRGPSGGPTRDRTARSGESVAPFGGPQRR